MYAIKSACNMQRSLKSGKSCSFIYEWVSTIYLLSLYSQNYAETCNNFFGSFSASLRLRATQLLSKKCRSRGEPLATLCLVWDGLRFEPQTSSSKNERVTAQPFGRFYERALLIIQYYPFLPSCLVRRHRKQHLVWFWSQIASWLVPTWTYQTR